MLATCCPNSQCSGAIIDRNGMAFYFDLSVFLLTVSRLVGVLA